MSIQKAKEQEKFKVNQPIVEGGLKFAPLESSNSRPEPEISVTKKTTTTLPLGIPVNSTQLNFTNSNMGGSGNFAPLEKPKQDILAD